MVKNSNGYYLGWKSFQVGGHWPLWWGLKIKNSTHTHTHTFLLRLYKKTQEINDVYPYIPTSQYSKKTERTFLKNISGN